MVSKLGREIRVRVRMVYSLARDLPPEILGLVVSSAQVAEHLCQLVYVSTSNLVTRKNRGIKDVMCHEKHEMGDKQIRSITV